MNEQQRSLAQRCLNAAHEGSLSFPEIVSRLIEAGFESYSVDFRRRAATYYLPSGDSLDLPFEIDNTPIAVSFDVGAISDAIREAQRGHIGYTYAGFCERIKMAGCIGYVVSFAGRRTVYFGRTAETHVEHFPD